MKIILTEVQFRRVIVEQLDTTADRKLWDPSDDISASDRIHYSSSKITDPKKNFPAGKNYTEVSHEQGKPTGLWYGFGDDWKNNWNTGLSDKRVAEYAPNFKYVYKVNINPSAKIYIIDKNSVQEFEKKYGVKHKGFNLIDWGKVKEDGYDGVELVDRFGAMQNSIYEKDETHSFPWYPWDIDSGAIWNPNVIELEQILPKEENNMSDKKIDGEYCGSRPFYNCYQKAIDEWWNDDEAKNWVELFKKDGFDTALSSIVENSWNSLENQAELIADLIICYGKCEKKTLTDMVNKIPDEIKNLTIGDVTGINLSKDVYNLIEKWWNN